MNEDFPYIKLILSTDKSKWKKFASVNGSLQFRLTNQQDFLNETFALYIILNSQYQKWLVVASNKVKTNSQTKAKIDQLFEVFKVKLASSDYSQHLTNQTFISNSLVKIVLQTLQLDFIMYGDKLRNNDVDKYRWVQFHRNFFLTATNLMVFYGVPVLLVLWEPIFIPLIFVSIICNYVVAYRRTKRFYFKNQLERIKNETLRQY